MFIAIDALLEDLKSALAERHYKDSNDLPPEAQELIGKAKESLSEIAQKNFTPKDFAKRFPGFRPWKLVISDANRDDFYGPYGISDAEHLTPKIDKTWHRLAMGDQGDKDSELQEYVLFADKEGDYVLRFKAIGPHKAEGKKDVLPTALWLFYLKGPKATGVD